MSRSETGERTQECATLDRRDDSRVPVMGTTLAVTGMSGPSAPNVVETAIKDRPSSCLCVTGCEK